jgi:hypothetical protein
MPKIARKKSQVNAVFTGDFGGGGGDFNAAGAGEEGGDKDVSSVVSKEAAKRMRMKAAQRQARAAAGAARAEALRVGLEQRSAYTVVDFLSTAEVLGENISSNNASDSSASSVTASTPNTASSNSAARTGRRTADLPDPAAFPSFVCIDALAKAFGLGPPRVNPEMDEDRTHLKKLARRMDASAQRALLYSKGGGGLYIKLECSLPID